MVYQIIQIESPLVADGAVILPAEDSFTFHLIEMIRHREHLWGGGGVQKGGGWGG